MSKHIVIIEARVEGVNTTTKLVDDILGNQAEVEKQLDTKLKDFKIAGDDKVLTAVDPEEFTVYAFKYADEAEEDFKSDEGYDPEIIQLVEKK